MNSHYRIILAFGSNLGSRESHLTTALKYLYEKDSSFQINKQSKFVQNPPFANTSAEFTQNTNKTEHPDYLNFVADCSTNIHPLKFYQDIIVPIEDFLGHSRTHKWAPRALDIDVLLSALNDSKHFHQCSPFILQSEFFQIPHKRLLDSDRKILQDLLKETFDLTFERIQCHFTQTLCEKN